MVRPDGRFTSPLLAALGVVALALGGLLVGYEPINGDPDNMYRPFKAELARALREGGLPLWSDKFGVGTPLAAESHVAAFYPPNWVFYRVLSVSAAYRLSMWVHYLALVVATYLYARALKLTAWGGALASVAFALCGFQESHACHEPFYHLLPYLPLSLLCAERYLAGGGVPWLAALALGVGAQFTLGHFQIQTWTAGLVVLTVLWRVLGREAPWRRGAGVLLGLGWGLAVAAVQLALTYELTKVAGFNRPVIFMTNFAFPPSHWAQLVLPGLYMGFRGGAGDPYWHPLASSSDEACLYVGGVPLVLAASGWLARRDRALGIWRWLAPLSFVLATMPLWWSDGFKLLLNLPVLGHFRAPGRYTLLTCLGLCLLAGRGFDRALPARRSWTGWGLALIFSAAATAWAVHWTSRPEVVAAFDVGVQERLIAAGLASWLVALGVVAAWRSGRLPPWVPLLVTACELGFLYYHGTTRWGWAVRYPDDSPVLRRLVEEPGVQRVTGWVRNIPVRVGLTTADPYFGVTPPPPNYLLESIVHPELATDWDYRPWVRRFGITHGVIDDTVQIVPATVLFRGEDPMLHAVLPTMPNKPDKRVWRLERYTGAFPEARAAVRVEVAKDWYEIFPRLTQSLDQDVVWFLREDLPADPPGPRATRARVVRWDGFSGEVEHDGTCDLVTLRAYYPGWFARIDGGPEVPVVRGDGGFQTVRLPGAGVTKVSVHFRPVHLARATGVSLAAAAAAVALLAVTAVRNRRVRAAA
jgi:hypothetical protein